MRTCENGQRRVATWLLLIGIPTNAQGVGWGTQGQGLGWGVHCWAGQPAKGGHPAATDLVYPGASWATLPPDAVGMDAATLTALQEYVGGHGFLVRHVVVAAAWGEPSRCADVASACKPVYTHFLLVAIEEQRIADIESRVWRFEPRLADLNGRLGFKDRGIRWRELACQTSCYGVAEAPGSAFDYSDFNMALFFDLLFLKVYGSSWQTVDEEVLRSKLGDRIGCQDQPTFLAFGAGDRPGRLAISPRDFARFGLLYLRGGKWKSQQLVRPEHVRLAVTSPLPNAMRRTSGKPAEMIAGQRSIGGGSNQTDHLGSYSFAWWTNGIDRAGNRHWPDAPLDTYAAFGHEGMRALVVIPSLDLVISWNDAEIRGRDMQDRALELASTAVVR